MILELQILLYTVFVVLTCVLILFCSLHRDSRHFCLPVLIGLLISPLGLIAPYAILWALGWATENFKLLPIWAGAVIFIVIGLVLPLAGPPVMAVWVANKFRRWQKGKEIRAGKTEGNSDEYE